MEIDDCDQLCHNEDGGYRCSCEEGYMLLDNNRSCEGTFFHSEAVDCVSLSKAVCVINITLIVHTSIIYILKGLWIC